jgi:hypothetical protein
MRMANAIWFVLGVSLTSPVSAYAEEHTTAFHHIARVNHSAFRAQVDPPAQFTTSHGRLAPTTYPVFTRDAGMCNVSLCIGY